MTDVTEEIRGVARRAATATKAGNISLEQVYFEMIRDTLELAQRAESPIKTKPPGRPKKDADTGD
jgi:hypothetical protein